MNQYFLYVHLIFFSEQCEDLVGKPAAIDRFIDELTTNDSKPPDSWTPGLTAGVATDPQEQMDQEAIVQSIREQGERSFGFQGC